jgi:hypothetical protein
MFTILFSVYQTELFAPCRDAKNEKSEEKEVAADKEEVKVEAVKEDKPSGDAQPI